MSSKLFEISLIKNTCLNYILFKYKKAYYSNGNIIVNIAPFSKLRALMVPPSCSIIFLLMDSPNPKLPLLPL